MEKQKQRRQKVKEREGRESEDSPADIVFHGGDIFTIDDKNPKVEALAVKGERILAIGDWNDVKRKVKHRHTEVVDLKGQTLLPGFVAAHEHATFVAATRFLYVDISAYGVNGEERDKDKILEIINTTVARADPDEKPLPWCLFMGWDIELIPDLPTLDVKVLDQISNKVPIMVIAQNLHAAWVNSKVFKECNITSPDQCPPGGIYVADENGELTGMLLEEPATKYVLAHAPVSNLRLEAAKAIQEQWKDYATRGFTTVSELGHSPMKEIDLSLSATATLDDCPVRLALYVSVSSKAKHEIIENDKMWVVGDKVWADGSPHCGTSALSEPYLDNEMTRRLAFPPPPPPPAIPDPPKCGILCWSNDKLFEIMKGLHDKGRQIAVHAHGERAIDQTLNIFKQLMKPGDDRRHRLEHAGFITEDQLKLCGELGVLPSFFVYQLYFYGKSFYNNIVGPERTNRWAPVGTAVKYIDIGKISIHEDHPGIPGPSQPFANIKTAVTRTQRDDPNMIFGKENCITVEQAIKASTIGPAYQLFRDDEIGSLEVGKFADLVILSKNPYKVDPLKLDSDIEVVETYIGGRCNCIKNMFK